MTTKEKLEELLHYYRFTRKVGHTSLMKAGTNNMENKLILVADLKDHAHVGVPSGNAVSWNSLDRLRGNDKPLAIDNAAMDRLLSDTLELIYELESKANKNA